ncbi:hypothetical protein [Mobilicoccus pelagius]|uniref:STAS domain-containing protein n=1 Tax=Mobilicoccus pelagius NBRC 104925 TaxID=1089455 RepID=H5UN91_9MICO|nr:hypothetical protein [Mobilicoccus pelagius]GAB47199.1 hypothetical protein MOPEL_007_00160 [Mobilicoccus pelagius NBRC 104925]
MTTRESRRTSQHDGIPNNNAHRTRAVAGELTLDLRGAASREIVSRLYEVQVVPVGTIVVLDVDSASEWTPSVSSAVRAVGCRADFVVTSTDGLALSRWYGAIADVLERDQS